MLGGERGHSLALYTAVPGLLRVRRLRGGAGQLRGVSAVFGVRDARDGPSRRRQSQQIIARCPRDAGSACLFTSMRVCMRWPRGPTLSFLGGPAEVQPFGPLRAFLAAELSAASWRPYGLFGGLPLARRQLGIQGGCARRGGAHWSRCARGATSDCFPAEKKVGVTENGFILTLCIYIYIYIYIYIPGRGERAHPGNNTSCRCCSRRRAW